MTKSSYTEAAFAIESIEQIHIELARQHFQITEEFVEALVVEGVFEPRSNSIGNWHLSANQYHLLRRAARLHHDLGVNPPGIALALELMAQLDAQQRS